MAVGQAEQSPGGENSKERMYAQTKSLLSPWFRFFLTYEPKDNLSKLKIPVLAIDGEHDLQVPAKENLVAIESALKKAGNKNYKIIDIPKLNSPDETAFARG